MEVKLIEKLVVVPEKPTERRRFFLSMLDLFNNFYLNTVSFVDPPTNNMSFCEIYNNLRQALSCLLVPYDFVAGRLVAGIEDKEGLEIDCNGAGIVFAAATTEASLSQLGQLLAPKPEYKKLVCFLHDNDEEKMELKDKPLLYVQVTQFACGNLAIGIRYNHTIMDGTAFSEFKKNWAAVSRGDGLVIEPKPDRVIFRERNPPIVNHLHPQFSTASTTETVFSRHGSDSRGTPSYDRTHLVYLSPQRIASLKKAALKDGKIKKCTTFQVVAAKMWKAWSSAVKMKDDVTCTLLIPTDVRKIIRPNAPNGFAGNAVVTSFAKARAKELKEKEDSYLVTEVQEGINRVDDDYVRTAIDCLKVNGGFVSSENSILLVAWWRLGLEEDIFAVGKLKCTTSVGIPPGLALLLPDLQGEGGINVCFQLPDAQMDEFERIMMEC